MNPELIEKASISHASDKICEAFVDCGASRVRGWHNTKQCKRPARYVVTHPDGHNEYLCGVHARSYMTRYGTDNIAKL